MAPRSLLLLLLLSVFSTFTFARTGWKSNWNSNNPTKARKKRQLQHPQCLHRHHSQMSNQLNL